MVRERLLLRTRSNQVLAATWALAESSHADRHTFWRRPADGIDKAIHESFCVCKRPALNHPDPLNVSLPAGVSIISKPLSPAGGDRYAKVTVWISAVLAFQRPLRSSARLAYWNAGTGIAPSCWKALS